MSRDLLYHNDIRFIEWAGDLSAADWAQPSLCAAWTNHDVLAHLVIGCSVAPTAIIAAMRAQHGSFDEANAELARRLAGRRSPTDLIDDYTRLIATPQGIGRVFPKRLLLGDHVIHELDIGFALDRPSGVEPAQLAAVLNTQVRVPNPFVPAAARSRNLRLQATDVAWRHGSAGPLVTGTGAHLASALAGRPWALRHLSGDGVAVLRRRL
jgi:uncharacterized protein (TIGR03083 family)